MPQKFPWNAFEPFVSGIKYDRRICCDINKRSSSVHLGGYSRSIESIILSNATKFREVPRNHSVLLGEEVLLRCSLHPSNSAQEQISQWRANTGSLLGNHEAGILPGHAGRYSYVRDAPEELHLKIDDIKLEDDGKFECQMGRADVGPVRAAAFVNVLVPPQKVYFQHYKADTVLEVNEGTLLNITCVGKNAKPAADIKWYINGKLINDHIKTWHEYNGNKTVTSYAALVWKPSKNDHNKVLTCEAGHKDTSTELRTSLTLNVLYSSERPSIDVVGSKNSVKSGQNVTLLCQAAGGNPPPSLTWHLHERPIPSQYEYDFINQVTRNSYSFIAEGSDNGAVYECHSSNRPGVQALKNTITLEVRYPPNNVLLYGDTTVRKGQSTTVRCVSGPSNPGSVITWTVNGSPTKVQQQLEKRLASGISTESNITIDSKVLLSDKNHIKIECMATNDEGSTSEEHIIRVLSPPSPPYIYGVDQEAMLEGEKLNLSCEAHGGHPLANLTWYRGVEKLKPFRNTVSGDTAQSMVMIPLDRSMNNVSIRCEAENGALDHPLVATKIIHVLFPPKRVIVRQPEHDPQMIAGQAARLTCNVPSSNPAAEITWEFDTGDNQKPRVEKGQYLYNRTSQEYGGFEVENFVTFTPTEKMHGTSVRCIASHPLWNDVKSNSFVLNVYYPPRVIVDGPISIVVGEGESFRENITVLSNPPVAAYRWRKNGVYFENSIGSIYTRGSTIGGRAINPADTGIYTMVANNIYGSTNISMKLTVEYPARVTFITSPIIASVGEEVVLECEADGVPKKKGMVKWMRGNSELKNLVPGEEKRAVLRINATHENAGPYVCVADNGVGQPNYTTAYLLVRKPPQILRTRGADRAAGPLGGRARLKCRASAVPGVTFQWSLEGQPAYIQHNSSKYLFHDRQLDHSTFESTLWIIGLDERDYSRRVRCGVSNNLGNDHIYIGIGPPTNPDVPTEFEVVNVTDKSAILTWVPGFDGGYDQTFEIRYQMRGSLKNAKAINVSESHITLTNLEPEKIYYIQIRAVNEQGRTSEFSLPAVEIHTLSKGGTNAQKSTETEEAFSKTTLIAFLSGLIILLLINCILLCYLHRRQKIKKIQEKTEIVRTLNPSTDGNVRPVQMYGAIGAGTPGMSRRPDSMNTNKSELVDHCTDIDAQSQRTVIEVSPNGYMQRYDPNYYDPNVIVEYDTDPIYYSKINKNNGTLGSQITYTSIPHPEPPENARLIDAPRYGEIMINPNGTLTRNQGHGSLNGSRMGLMDSPRRYRTGLLGTVPTYASSQNAYGQYPSSPADLPPLPTDSANNNNYGGYMTHQRSPPPPAQMFSTFSHPGGVRTASTANMPLPDGDLV